ncbi:MAG: hypothetical protein ABR969_02020 [Sedimentisphaerales bacterium]|jgi:hypothetical protein
MLKTLQEIHQQLKDLRKDVALEHANSISKKTIRERAEILGTKWFKEIVEPLKAQYNITSEVADTYSENFERLIKISAPNNLKKSYLETLGFLSKSFRDDFILPMQKNPKSTTDISLLSKMLEGLPDQVEDEYLKEAINCAKHKYYRAAVVLGWCTAINRIHNTIEKIGFAKFNVTSATMASQQIGRFKKFNQPQNISSINELRQVFDTIIIWILEGMQLIDFNQHTRLRSCFDLRCQCAHPGDAPITEYNLLSYFSDLNEIVLKNPKFN